MYVNSLKRLGAFLGLTIVFSIPYLWGFELLMQHVFNKPSQLISGVTLTIYVLVLIWIYSKTYAPVIRQQRDEAEKESDE